LRSLTGAQQAVIDEYTRQRIPYGPVHQCGGDRGVHPTGQPADQLAALSLSPDCGDRFLDHIRGSPIGPDAGDLMQEAAQHLLAMRRMHHLGVVLHTRQPPINVLEGRHR
jgi:hypothetical protein